MDPLAGPRFGTPQVKDLWPRLGPLCDTFGDHHRRFPVGFSLCGSPKDGQPSVSQGKSNRGFPKWGLNWGVHQLFPTALSSDFPKIGFLKRTVIGFPKVFPSRGSPEEGLWRDSHDRGPSGWPSVCPEYCVSQSGYRFGVPHGGATKWFPKEASNTDPKIATRICSPGAHPAVFRCGITKGGCQRDGHTGFAPGIFTRGFQSWFPKGVPPGSVPRCPHGVNPGNFTPGEVTKCLPGGSTIGGLSGGLKGVAQKWFPQGGSPGCLSRGSHIWIPHGVLPTAFPRIPHGWSSKCGPPGWVLEFEYSMGISHVWSPKFPQGLSP
jgi:hypothetical protein